MPKITAVGSEHHLNTVLGKTKSTWPNLNNLQQVSLVALRYVARDSGQMHSSKKKNRADAGVYQ